MANRTNENNRPAWKTTLAHTLCWAVFLALPTVFKPVRPGEESLWHDLVHTPRLLNGALLVAVFYFNYFFAIPRLYLRGRYQAFALSALGCLALLFVLNGAIISPRVPGNAQGGSGFGPGGPPNRSPGFSMLGPSHNTFMFFIAYMASFGLRIYQQWRQATEEKLNAEIALLRAQINPHFLFNTLNSIYSLALTKSDAAAEAVVKLSQMMRYTTLEATHRRVPLADEVAYIENYTALQKLRVPAITDVHFTSTVHAGDLQVAPLLLVSFVENAFKYGVSATRRAEIDIDLKTVGDSLHMRAANTRAPDRALYAESTGLGIENTRRRLELLYPGRHRLQIEDRPDMFIVSLMIKLA